MGLVALVAVGELEEPAGPLPSAQRSRAKASNALPMWHPALPKLWLRGFGTSAFEISEMYLQNGEIWITV